MHQKQTHETEFNRQVVAAVNASNPLIATATRPADALQVLRRASAGAHHSLENSQTAKALLSKRLTRERYAAILQRWLSVWLPLEKALDHWKQLSIPPRYVPPRRVPLMQGDLVRLGVAHPTTKPITLPSLLRSPEAWFGIAYVLRGAYQGSPVIRQHLSDVFGHSPQFPLTAFRSVPVSGNKYAPWSEWLHWLEGEIHQRDNLTSTLKATNATFKIITQCFNQNR